MTITTKTMMTIATTIDYYGEVRDRCPLFFVSWRMLARSLGVEAPAPGRAPGHRHYPRGRAATTTGSEQRRHIKSVSGRPRSKWDRAI